MKFPRGIPKHMPTILGDVPVRLVKKLKDKKGTPLMGHWKMKDREICLCDGINSAAMRQALWHEWLHAVLIDAGARASLSLSREFWATINCCSRDW